MDFDISHEILIDANRLRNNGVQRRQIKEIVIDILKKINDELRAAHIEGKHMIITEIPIIFDISNMNISDARRSVWSSVISSLKSKNYRVWISPSSDYCKIKITWISEEDELIFRSQKEILQKHTKQF